MTKLIVALCIFVGIIIMGIGFWYGSIGAPDKYLHVPLLSFVLYIIGGIIVVSCSLIMYARRKEEVYP